MVDPYDARAIPDGDIYGDIPLYGRFEADEHTFKFDATKHTPTDILAMCNSDTELMPDRPDGRTVYAVGNVIVKWHDKDGNQSYANADANECAALQLVSESFPWLPCPNIHFQGKVDGMDVLIQSRIEGVALNVAWPYLQNEQKLSFKQQARDIVMTLFSLKGPPQYIYLDENPVVNKRISQEEVDILLPKNEPANLLGFAHNDLQPSNIIVKADRIVGIIDWEMAGFFGERAAQVHRRFRHPGKEAFARVTLSELELERATCGNWVDLYDNTF